MKLTQKILFNKDECDFIISNQIENMINWNMNDRKYDSKTIYYNESTKWIFDKLKYFFEIETDLKIIKIKQEIHFHKFIEGSWFGKHNDNRDERLYAVGVLLNNNFQGGDFKFYNPNEYILNREIGNAYIFDTKTEHEITEILSGTRYSLLWFLQKEHIKIKPNTLI
jgi:hypothetical protein